MYSGSNFMKSYENVKKSKRRKKQFAVEQFGGKCVICGYDRCVGALDFHHVDPETKTANPAHIILHWSWERAKEELKKCVLICANCHREHHFNSEFESSYERFYREPLDKRCIVCGNSYESFSEKSQTCSPRCRATSQRKVIRPSKEDLQALIERNSWVALGVKFGVSDNAVRKWAKQYGLL